MTVSRVRLPREPGMSKKKAKKAAAEAAEAAELEKKPRGYPQGKKGSGKRLRQVKIAEVEDQLEEVRNEVIAFGAPLARVPLEQLYTVDVPADDGAQESAAADDNNDEEVAIQPRLSRAEAKRQKWRQKTAAVFDIYDPKNLSKVEPLFNKPAKDTKYRAKQRIRTPSAYSAREEHVDPLTLVGRDEDLWLAAERERQQELERRRAEADPALPEETVASMLEAEKRLLCKVNTSKRVRYQPSALRPIQPADLHSGVSYRPEESARQEIVQIAAAHELRVQRELKYFERNKIKQAKRTHGMFVDTLSTVELEEDPEAAKEARSRALLRPPMPGKVTARDRRAQKRERVEAFKIRIEARSTRVLRQMKKLAEIESQLKTKHQQNRSKRINRHRARALFGVIKPKKVSQFTFKEEPRAVLLSDEIPERLSALRTTVNPFVEIQRSFERRNMTEVIDKNRKKPKVQRVRTAKYEHASTKFATWNYQPPTDL